ncbi:hypothetical protein GCM10010123_36430 [Pilimelia anulata]|uniref:Uncharacterized protein n=1 Tax=Pilimelia anulata TaxID=53371 RepID=A0A8J3B934_9ACTN|nr:glycosyltransferase family 2 protein [Pilimelia anulata]GGK03192.1 hypothetical protein GCM10010123_36430 [Pilimelia anulata]
MPPTRPPAPPPPDRPRRIHALIPVHRRATVAETIDSLRRQTRPPEEIVAVVNNCRDDTAAVARAAGARVIEMPINPGLKAGAINHGLALLDAELGDDDAVFVMDADTTLAPVFFAEAERRLADPAVGGVGGSFYAATEDNLLRVVQGNEYARYVRQISRRPLARANVLTGAGAMFRVGVLREVRRARDEGRLPGTGYYQTGVLTEDNELSLAIQRLGYRIVSPKACALYTEAPATLGELWHQRVRWRRGALENLRDHGLNRTTWPYLTKTCWTAFVTLLSLLYLGLIAGIAATDAGSLRWQPFWIGVFLVYLADRVWTCRGRGARPTAVALCAPIEIAYDLFQQLVFIAACYRFARRSDQRWAPPDPEGAPCTAR